MPLTGKPQWRHHLEAVHPLHRSPQRLSLRIQLRQKPDLTSYLDGGELLRHLSARFGGGPLLRPEEPHPSTTAASPNLDNDWEVHLLEEAEQWENWSSVWTPASGRGHGWSSTPSRGRTVTGTVPPPPPPLLSTSAAADCQSVLAWGWERAAGVIFELQERKRQWQLEWGAKLVTN